ncbi:LuxR family transcriptional regulator [Sphingobium sp. AEW4]|nr:LuxR family transcriptional regulator [Sphingobium sp. AEW4]
MPRRSAMVKGRITVPEQNIPAELEPYRAAVAQLTDRQRECMALVAENLTSKKIGKELGIAPNTVDKHVKTVRAMFGDMDRFDVARIIRSVDEAVAAAGLPPQNLGSQSIGLSPRSVIAPSGPSDNDADAQSEMDRSTTLGKRVQLLTSEMPTLLNLLPLRTSRRQSNDLNRYYLLIAFAVLSAWSLVSVGSAASLLSSLGSLARD